MLAQGEELSIQADRKATIHVERQARSPRIIRSERCAHFAAKGDEVGVHGGVGRSPLPSLPLRLVPKSVLPKLRLGQAPAI